MANAIIKLIMYNNTPSHKYPSAKNPDTISKVDKVIIKKAKSR